MAVSKAWGDGTIAALMRRQRGDGPRLTVQQVLADLRDENARLRDKLNDAHHEIERLRHKLAVLEATAGRDELISQAEAARRMQVNPSTISRWVAAGHLQLHRPPGSKRPMIYASSLVRPPTKKRGRRKA